MVKFTDEVKDLHEIYLYMKDEGFSDKQFVEAAEDLVRKNTYSRNAMDVMVTIYGIDIPNIVPPTPTPRVKKTKQKSVIDSIKKVTSAVIDNDPCSGVCRGSRNSPCA